MVVKHIENSDIFVVPVKWLFEIKKNWEKITNYGINTNQIFLAYHTDLPEAHDENGIPKNDFHPNFDARGPQTCPCIEMCFHVKLLKYKGN